MLSGVLALYPMDLKGSVDVTTIFFMGIVSITGLITSYAIIFYCYPYLLRLVYSGHVLRDKRIGIILKALISENTMDFKVEMIYELKGLKANAAVSGMFRSSRFIFFTRKLLETMSEDEIKAILAHELAHIKHKHLLKNFVFFALGIIVVILINPILAEYIGYYTNSGLLRMAIISILGQSFLFLVVLLPGLRQHEYEADATAARWVGSSCYQQALYRLYQINGYTNPQPRYVELFATHPTLDHRLERISRLPS
jgi:Zn-dependent protease with chaperone function